MGKRSSAAFDFSVSELLPCNKFFEAPPVTMDVDDQVAEKELRERLIQALGKLGTAVRVPVALHYLHGYEVGEIADLMDMKFNTVKGRLRKGVAKLRKHVLADPALREWVGSGMI